MNVNYKIIDTIKCFTPDLAYENADYPKYHFELLYGLESKNFWFRSRSKIIEHLFSRFLQYSQKVDILEVGCGTGFVLKGLSKFKNFKLYGADLHIEGLKFAKQRVPEAEFFQLDLRKIPFSEEFDAVGAFDVLEHIDEDELVIKNIYKALKPHGFFFVSVPQHKWLWSTQDDTSFHKRRYSKNELIKKLASVGFKVQYFTSFVFALLPLMIISRLRMKRKISTVTEYDYGELGANVLINFLLSVFMFFDEVLIKFGFNLPVGGSLIVVARK